MIVYFKENRVQHQNINTANKLYENAGHFKYLGMTLTDQNCMPAHRTWVQIKVGSV